MKKIFVIIVLMICSSQLFAQKISKIRLEEDSKEYIAFKNSKKFNSINFSKLEKPDKIDLVTTDKTKGSVILMTFSGQSIIIIVTQYKSDYELVLIKSRYSGKSKNSGKIEYCDGQQKTIFYQNYKKGKLTFTSEVIGYQPYIKTYKQCVESAENILKDDFLGDIALTTNPGVPLAIRICCAINPDCFD
jgi:hypothetical protein